MRCVLLSCIDINMSVDHQDRGIYIPQSLNVLFAQHEWATFPFTSTQLLHALQIKSASSSFFQLRMRNSSNTFGLPRPELGRRKDYKNVPGYSETFCPVCFLLFFLDGHIFVLCEEELCT